MRSVRFAGLLAVLMFAASAFGSPLFGTWKLELNGQPVTVVVSYVERHVEGKMIVGTGTLARDLPMIDARIIDRPPSTLRFEVANFNGTGKTMFELHSIDGDNATLRKVEEGVETTQMKAVKQK